MASCVRLFTSTARLDRRHYGSVNTVERGGAFREIQIQSYGSRSYLPNQPRGMGGLA